MTGKPPHLTPTEAHIVIGLARGMSYAEIAQCLNVTHGTVQSMRKRAARRLGATNSTHLVALAIARRLIPAGAALPPVADPT